MLSCMGSTDSRSTGLQSLGCSGKRKGSPLYSPTTEAFPEGLVTSGARGDKGEIRPIKDSDWGSRKLKPQGELQRGSREMRLWVTVDVQGRIQI